MNLFMKFIAISFASLLLTHVAVATNDTADEKIKSFFELVEAGKHQEAVDTHMTPEVLTIMGGKLKSIVGQMEGWGKAFGQSRGFEKIYAEKISSRIAHHVYVLYYDGVPVTYSFFLYKEEDGWGIISFKFNTEFNNLSRYSPN